VASNVKIYEIAKAIGISSAELVEVCQKAGFDHIAHHSQAVPPGEADEIRKAAIRLYKPKEAPALKEEPKAPPKEKKKPTGKAVPSTKDVKPVAPPKPRGTRTEEEESATSEPKKERRRPRRRGRRKGGEEEEELTKRTIVFKQPKRHVATKRIEKVELERPVTVRDFSAQSGLPASGIIKELMFEHGIRANINQILDDEVAQLIGVAHDIEVTFREPKSAEDELLESLPEDAPEDLRPRPPVITLLGHVDHGKTSILDRIRNTRVAESEAGGITQDIGAWQTRRDGRTLTFIDTPGHEAFTAMRARGAQVTDLVVLVVAADDGVMPQTVEAIDHARAAEVPIVVAVNKTDKPDANPMRVKQQLAGYGLNPEDWGGETGCVELSALTGEGIDELLERVMLEAELLEVKANPDRRAIGAALEARMEPGRGAVANLIVQKGTLHRGDITVCGDAFGTIRSMVNDRGEEVEEALPAQPVAVSGLGKVPEAGDVFVVVDSLETARKVAQERQKARQQRRLQPRQHVTLENLFERLERGETKQLNIVLKADVQGSLAPLVDSLGELGNQEVSVRVVHSGIGRVNPSDVLLADAADAVIVAFRVGTDDKVREMASQHGVEITNYDVIYNVTDQVHAALEGMLEPEKREERAGVAEIRQTFQISRFGTVAGCYVREGAMRRSDRIRVRRDGEVLFEGEMASLRQGKTDVREVEAGRECGINVSGFNDFVVGDLIECFRVVSVKRTLEPRAAKERAESENPAAR
jgi:translation initiation factor IF-2